MQNTVVTPSANISITAKNRPFSNNFVQTQFVKTMRTRNGRDAFVVVVKCTSDSMEPGRLYCCTFTQAGTLLACYTLN